MHWITAPIRVPEKSSLRIGEVAAAIGHTPKSVRALIQAGDFPAGRMVGRELRWSNLAVGVWLLWQDYRPDGPGSPESSAAKG